MPDRSEQELLAALRDADDAAFERIYELFQQRVRVTAWRVSHRADWVDELVSETWCRAFKLRRSYDPSRLFLVWMAGILQNVYREQCRNSPTIAEFSNPEAGPDKADEVTPEALASEAEMMVGLNYCVDRLGEQDAEIVRLRFFDGKTLRVVAQEVNVAESTLREVRIPAILKALRKCLASKGIKISEIFPAQEGLEDQ